MLVIVSDLHLTDGSTGEMLSPETMRIFARRLEELARAASWRTDGTYRPIERLDLVLLGDVLDPIRSVRWAHPANLRPWGDPHSADFIEQITRISCAILKHNAESLSILRGLASHDGVTVPPATRSGRPAPASPGQGVVVRIHYMVGNHDWFFHLGGAGYDSLRRTLASQMGLANPSDYPFPHEMGENDELLEIMRRHNVAARHGDLYDPLNFDGDRDTASLGDAIVIELVNRFSTEVESAMGDDLPAATILGLREIDHVRPLLLIPVWIDGLLERTCVRPATRKRVKTVWDRLADEFLQLDFVRQHDTLNPLDSVDGLQRALKFSKRLSVGWASATAEWLHGLRGGNTGSYYRHALAEQDFRNRRAKHIVYGHTHEAEIVPLDASYAEGYVLDQLYFNTGTWRRVHRQTQLAPAEHEFIASDVMTCLTFFQGDERGGRPYETWSGTLGYRRPEAAMHRIDPGNTSHDTGQSISTPGLQAHPPHFTSPSGQPRIVPIRRN
ncbi:MAG: hypothetical protein HQ567_08550 [Candidatus Nealsonbacteria bacterium]|nr:hypothetical protein [Candidatus Nealsonbacteria bacterium]